MRAGFHFEYRVNNTIFQAIHPAMQMRNIIKLPGSLYNRGFGQVHHLLFHIQLYQFVAAFVFICNAVTMVAEA